MNRIICGLLAMILCFGMCACGNQPQKSAEATKTEELIAAIGEVTLDSKAAIIAAQEAYDALTSEQKAEVTNYDTLVAAQELLSEKKLEALHKEALELMEQGDYIAASSIVYDHPEFSDYALLVEECGSQVIPQYIMEQGEEKDSGKYFIKLVEEDGTTISLWYLKDKNAIEFVYYYSGNGLEDGIFLDYTIGGDNMLFMRESTNMTLPINSQVGTVSVADYTGTFSGSIADNSKEPLVIPGLTITSFETAYDNQTRGYHTATMQRINEMLDVIFEAVVREGYRGTIADIGFTAYKQEQQTETETGDAQISPEVFEKIKAFILENGSKKSGVVNFSYDHKTQKYVVPVTFIYSEEKDEIWVQAIHMQKMNVYYQLILRISASNNTVSFETQHASLDSSHASGVRILKGIGTLELQKLTALTPLTFTEVTDNTEKGVPEGYEVAFGNRINAVLSAMDEFLLKNNLGSLKQLGFCVYIPPVQVGEMTFELK